MYPLKRYFAIIAALSIALAAGAIAWIDFQFNLRQQTRFAEDRNVTISGLLVNSLRRLAPALVASPGTRPDNPGAAYHQMAHDVRELIAGTDILKLRIYAPGGLVVFSTQQNEIGTSRERHGPFMAALTGQINSEIVSETRADGREMQIIESYLPVRLNYASRAVGVLEVYSDITAASGEWRAESLRLAAYALPIMLFLYAVLYVFVRRASGIIDAQHRLLKRYVAELREAKDASDSASNAKTAFVANMSHEIRTPLNALIGTTELLRQTRLDTEQRAHVRTLHNSGEILMSIVNDVLDFARMEAGAVALDPSDFSPSYVIDALIDVLSPRALDKGLELAACISPQADATLRGDRERLMQILLNLAGNAIKFTESGQILIWVDLETTDRDNARLKVTIEDSGIGIDPLVIPSLFTPFSQADVSTTRRYGGTGLGLAICEQLASAMGGGIEVQSEPGKGSRFTLTLPFSLLATSPLNSESLPKLHGRKVLLVSSNARVLELLATHARYWSNEFDCAEDLPAARRRLQQAAAEGHPYFRAVVDLGELKPDLAPLLDLATSTTEAAVDRLVLFAPPTLLNTLSLMVNRLGKAGAEVECMAKPITTTRLANAIRRPARPREDEESQEIGLGPGASQPRPGGAAYRRPRVLIAEDVAVNRIMLLDMLSRLGFAADAVSDGQQALDVLGQQGYDLVLLDCQMPEKDGYEVTRQIRAGEGPNRDTVIVAVTANATTEDRTRCLDIGMNDYLSKPVRMKQLDHIMHRWIGTPEPVRGVAGRRTS